MSGAPAAIRRVPTRVVRSARGTACDTPDVRDADTVYRDLGPAVLGYLRAQGATDPEDLLMDVFVAVVRDLDGVRGDSAAVRRWVFTIAHHRVVDQRRHRARRTRLRSVDALQLDRVVPDAMSAGVDPELIAALAMLTPEQRDVLGLRVVADLPVADVARILRKRPDAVKSMQHRALTTLAARLS
jgi:RNA polymerase sigma factor (sigma-70 family)